MLDFNPARASPVPRRAPTSARRGAATNASSTISRTSTLAVPELANLLPEDVELLDAVLDRAGRNATSFLTVFKAYSDILQERGLDPNEVVYYGKILKLGSVKGTNWQDKWSEVKRQNGFVSPPSPAVPIKKSVFPLLPQDDESFTLFSTENGAGAQQRSELDSDFGHHQIRRPPREIRRSPSPFTSAMTSDGTEDGITKLQDFPLLMPPAQITRPTSKLGPQHRPWKQETNLTTPLLSLRSKRCPSNDKPLVSAQRQPFSQTAGNFLPPTPSNGPHERVAVVRQAIARARQTKSSVVNEDDAWKNIEMRRNEEEADRFYNEKLIERFWDVWKQGYDWIITTNEQISEARDNIILQTHFQRWRERTTARLAIYSRVTVISNKRLLRRMLDVWKAKLKIKKQNQWRHDMRLKMKIVREKREAYLIRTAWVKWQQSTQFRLADRYHERHALSSFLCRWRNSLKRLDHLDAIADDVTKASDFRELKVSWLRWKGALRIRTSEKAVEDAVNLRIMDTTMVKWRSRLHAARTADAFHDTVVMKGTIRSWKAAIDRLRTLDSRAQKHLNRQDDILLRAVTRVWKARERGQLLQRVRSLRLLKKSWATWGDSILVQRKCEATADAFSRRLNSYDAKSALLKWHQALTNHRDSDVLAVRHHNSRVQHQSFRLWRSQLREKLKQHRKARMVENHLTTRRAWNQWQGKLAEKRRERQLKYIERKRLQTYYYQWLQRAQKARGHRLAEEAIVTTANLRVMSNALAIWTNRVIEIKLKEIEVTQRRDNMITSNAFNKWKTVCMRHVEELNLMESYQYVKREETVRRTFNRWLAAARASRHRRLILQKKEYQLKLSTISIAWDKWRDRFKAERLKPVEQDVILQMQRNLLFRAFGIWHAKTKSLPAIRFHASNTKAKYWEQWRAAMPRAMLAKTARDKHRKTVQAFYLNKWIQVYRTKMALKAVARARYLRLPTSTPRQVTTSSRPIPTVLTNAIPKQSQGEVSEDSDAEYESDAGRVFKPYAARKGIANLLSTERRAGVSPRVPVFLVNRDSSPTRSTVSRPVRSVRDASPVRSKTPFSDIKSETNGDSSFRRHRAPTSVDSEQARAAPSSRIWQELQEVRRKSRSRPSSTRG